MDNEKDKIAL